MEILLNLSQPLLWRAISSFPEGRTRQECSRSSLPAAAQPAPRTARTYWSSPPLWRRESSRAGPWHRRLSLSLVLRFHLKQNLQVGRRSVQKLLIPAGKRAEPGSERPRPAPPPARHRQPPPSAGPSPNPDPSPSAGPSPRGQGSLASRASLPDIQFA